MSPMEALDKVIWQGTLMSGMRRKPGAMIEHAPSHVREALKGLTSDHVANVRNDDLFVRCSR